VARIIKIDNAGPFKIEPKDFPKDGKSIWICGCGLTKTWPYCDKSHKACESEQPGKTYVYEGGVRREIPEVGH